MQANHAHNLPVSLTCTTFFYSASRWFSFGTYSPIACYKSSETTQIRCSCATFILSVPKGVPLKIRNLRNPYEHWLYCHRVIPAPGTTSIKSSTYTPLGTEISDFVFARFSRKVKKRSNFKPSIGRSKTRQRPGASWSMVTTP